MIVVTMTKNELNEVPLGKSKLSVNPFIHASTIELFPRILYKFISLSDLYLVYIDESKLNSVVKYEDKHDNQLYYPHIYGYINLDSVISIEPLIIKDGTWVRS